MNYIKQLSAVYQFIAKDSRLNPTHVSLYMALFQIWNTTRFAEKFFINRQEVMQLSKIGSNTTYHRCLQDLDNWKYIEYFPSHNIYKGSELRMPIFETTSKQVLDNKDTTTGHVLVSNTNSAKQKENYYKPKLPKNEIEVIGWKQGGKIKIVDWMASARNWMLKAKEIETLKEQSSFKDNLKTTKIKNYGEPL